MTVGHELEKITNLKLFHNHMTIDIISPLFGYWSKSPVWTKLVESFRKQIFEEFAKSDNEWLIFTYVWAFNEKSDWDYIDNICKIFEKNNAKVYFVELEADINKRLERNLTPHRLEHKPTKRDTKQSENELKETMEKYRLNSKEWELKKENYIRINNTNLSAEDTAKKIKEEFGL